MDKRFYGSIKYPAIARENGIGGVVILDIEVDQKGKVTGVDIKQSVSVECDNEARRTHFLLKVAIFLY
ncbi:MAG: TonB family protein [Saprospiraceae bacterium]|nr:TonB family protein [Saprospiraceae bacterium]